MILNDCYRLDLDACKSRVRKARSMLGQQSVSIVNHLFHLKMHSICLQCVLSFILLQLIGVWRITRSIAWSGINAIDNFDCFFDSGIHTQYSRDKKDFYSYHLYGHILCFTDVFQVILNSNVCMLHMQYRCNIFDIIHVNLNYRIKY